MAESPLYILLYEVTDDYLERRVPLRPEHLALATAAHERGELIAAGAFADPVDGAALVFTTKEAAEQFAESDPYVKAGIVTSWSVRGWTVVVGSFRS